MSEHRGRIPRRAPGWLWVAAWPAAIALVAAAAVLGSSRNGQPDSQFSPPPRPSGGLAANPSRSPTAPRAPTSWPRIEVEGLRPGPMALGAGLGRIWVASPAEGVVRAIDPPTAQVVLVALVAEPADHDTSPAIAVAAGSVWAAGMPDRRQILRIAPDTGTVLATVHVPADVDGLLGDARAVWAITPAGALGVDPETETLAHSIAAAPPLHAVLGARSLWLSSGATIRRIDPATGGVVAEIEGGGGPIGLREGTVWVRTPGMTSTVLTAIDEASGDVLERTNVATSGRAEIAWSLPGIEPNDPDSDRTTVAPRQRDLLATAASMWIARPGEGEVWRVARQ